jgi:hypothetical protein
MDSPRTSWSHTGQSRDHRRCQGEGCRRIAPPMSTQAVRRRPRRGRQPRPGRLRRSCRAGAGSGLERTRWARRSYACWLISSGWECGTQRHDRRIMSSLQTAGQGLLVPFTCVNCSRWLPLLGVVFHGLADFLRTVISELASALRRPLVCSIPGWSQVCWARHVSVSAQAGATRVTTVADLQDSRARLRF